MAKRGSGDRQGQTGERPAGATPEQTGGRPRRYDGEFVGRGMRDPRTLVPHPSNRSFPTNDDEWKSFVRSITEIGVIAPLICRLLEDERYQIVCGHRRQAAAIEAGLAEVPVELRQMDDKTAVAILTIENLQRRNPTPLQQAQGIADMLAVGWTLDEVAAELGMAPSVVARRNQLNHLTTAWQKLIARPDHLAAAAPVGVLERIARLPAELQDKLADDASDSGVADGTYDWETQWLSSVRAFGDQIERNELRRLNKAPWKLDDATLHPTAGACCACPNRSSAQPLLWEGELAAGGKPESDRCLNAECFQIKLRKSVETKITLQRQKTPDLVVVAHGNVSGKVGGATVRKSWEFGSAKKGDKGAVPAIDLDGADAGKLRWAKPYSAMGGSAGGKNKPANAGAKAGVTPLKQRRAELEKRRQARVVDAVQEMLEAVSGKAEFGTRLLRPEGAPMGNVSQMVQAIGLAATFGTNFRRDFYHMDGGSTKSTWGKLLEQLTGDPMDLVARLNRAVAGVLASRLTHHTNEGIDKQYGEAEYCCKLFDWDFVGLRAQAETEIPEPKSWANLNADGTPKAAQVKGKKKAAEKAMKAEPAKAKKPRKKGGDRGVADTVEAVEAGNLADGIEIPVPAEKAKGRTSPVYYEPTERLRLPIPTARKVTIELKLAQRKDGTWISAIEMFRRDGGESWAEDLTDRSVPVISRASAILQALDRIIGNAGGEIIPDPVVGDVNAYLIQMTAGWECLGCGCTNERACVGGCSWVNEDMCSQCAEPELVEAVLDLPLVPAQSKAATPAKKARKKAV